MRSNGWNSLGVSSGSFFRSRGLGSGERMLLHPLRVGSTIAITAHRQRPRWACVKYLTTCPRSRHLNPPSLSISPSDLPIPSPHAPHVHTPRCAALSAPAGGGLLLTPTHPEPSPCTPTLRGATLGAWCLPHVAASAAPLNTFQSPWSPARWSCPWSRAAC